MSAFVGPALVVLFLAGTIMLFIRGLRSMRKSRALVVQYRAATLHERQSLEQRMEADPDVETHMRPLAWWEILVAAIIIAGMLSWVARA